MNKRKTIYEVFINNLKNNLDNNSNNKIVKKKKINSFHIFAKKEEDKLSKIWNTIFPLKQIQTHKFVPGAA